MKFASLLFLVLWSPLVKSLRQEADASNEKPSFRASNHSFLAENERKPKTIAEVTKTFPLFGTRRRNSFRIIFKREKKIFKTGKKSRI